MAEKRVYLVDDEAAVRRSVGFMLKTSGFEVESFESGEAFSRRIREDRAVFQGVIERTGAKVN